MRRINRQIRAIPWIIRPTELPTSGRGTLVTEKLGSAQDHMYAKEIDAKQSKISPFLSVVPLNS
jgi:hypothetical protein